VPRRRGRQTRLPPCLSQWPSTSAARRPHGCAPLQDAQASFIILLRHAHFRILAPTRNAVNDYSAGSAAASALPASSPVSAVAKAGSASSPSSSVSAASTGRASGAGPTLLWRVLAAGGQPAAAPYRPN